MAKDISVPPRRINEIVHGTRAITPDTALRLSRYFGTTAMFWLNLQMKYDVIVAQDILDESLLTDVKVMEQQAGYSVPETDE